MQPLTLPTTIAALLPFLATALSSWLADDHLQPGFNALITLVAIVGTAVACELLAQDFTGNITTSFFAILGYVALLMNGDMHELYQYLLAKPSPTVRKQTTPPPIMHKQETQFQNQ